VALLPEPVRRFFSKTFSLLGKEQAALKDLHEESKATVRRMSEEDPGLRQLLDKAHAYAVFPSVGKATVVIGGAYGKGEVFQCDQLIGYAGLAQLTLGVQVGGQTFSEIILFQDEASLGRFKAGRTAFAANASAVLVKAGAAATSNYDSGTMVFVSSEGGMMLEAAIGAQKFVFKPAALGRTKGAPETGKTADVQTGKKMRPRRRGAAAKKKRAAAAGRKPAPSRAEGKTRTGAARAKSRSSSARRGPARGAKSASRRRGGARGS
jgi:lipid-binding SYLF domain-containing protein